MTIVFNIPIYLLAVIVKVCRSICIHGPVYKLTKLFDYYLDEKKTSNCL
jgi:hypothetical protein